MKHINEFMPPSVARIAAGLKDLAVELADASKPTIDTDAIKNKSLEQLAAEYRNKPMPKLSEELRKKLGILVPPYKEPSGEHPP
jgi:hypothetical protein